MFPTEGFFLICLACQYFSDTKKNTALVELHGGGLVYICLSEFKKRQGMSRDLN